MSAPRWSTLGAGSRSICQGGPVNPLGGQSGSGSVFFLPASSRISCILQLCIDHACKGSLSQCCIVHSSRILHDNNLKLSALEANHVLPGFRGLICFVGGCAGVQGAQVWCPGSRCKGLPRPRPQLQWQPAVIQQSQLCQIGYLQARNCHPEELS